MGFREPYMDQVEGSFDYKTEGKRDPQVGGGPRGDSAQEAG